MVHTPLDMGLAMVMAVTARGLLTLRLMPTMAMEAMVDTDSDTEATAMAVLATAMARGLLTPRLMPTMATEAMVDMVLATPLATVLATAMVVMARGQLTLRPMPTMAIVATAMARGLLMLMLMPSTAMEDMVLAFMESLPHVWMLLTSQSHAPMARGQLIPM